MRCRSRIPDEKPPDEVERAVAELVSAGLLMLEGEEIAPTAAAIRFNQIEPIDPPGQA